MARKGLNQEIVLQAAFDLIQDKGYNSFSLNELASKLGIKTASLYNHISNLAELNAKLGELVLHNINKEILENIKNESEPIDTLKNISIQYYNFAQKNPELYKTIIHMPMLGEKKVTDAAKEFVSIIYKILNKLNIAEEEQLHFSRSYRSAMHGFITLQEAHFFQSNVPNETSYEYMIDLMLKGLINSQKGD